jgi:hypothetical protein
LVRFIDERVCVAELFGKPLNLSKLCPNEESTGSERKPPKCNAEFLSRRASIAYFERARWVAGGRDQGMSFEDYIAQQNPAIQNLFPSAASLGI